jgi:uncharacterized protein YciI
MFIVLLKFSTNKTLAGQFMDAHNAWIQRGLDDGVFMLVGSLDQGMGGAILADNTSLQDLQARVNTDPFVVEEVVVAEILGITPGRTNKRLSYLLT